MKKLIFSQGSGSFRWDCWWSLQFSVTSLAALRPIPPAVVFSRDDQTHSIIALTITVGQLCYNDEVLYGLHKGYAHCVGNCKRISLPVESNNLTLDGSNATLLTFGHSCSLLWSSSKTWMSPLFLTCHVMSSLFAVSSPVQAKRRQIETTLGGMYLV